MIFSPNFTLLDVLRTTLDRTAKGGVLGVQDDLVAPDATVEDLSAELPFDRMDRRLQELGVELYDHRQTPRKKDSRGDGRAWGTRSLAKLTGVCWHQTACWFDDPLRMLSVPAHIGILPSSVVLLHPLRAYVPHGHTCNAFTLGVEVMARAAGIEGNRDTFWRSPAEKHGYHPEVKRDGKVIAKKHIGRSSTHPAAYRPPKSYEDLVHEATDRQLLVMEIVADYIVEEVERQAKIERAAGKVVPGVGYQLFHRNGRDDRTSDPGSRIALRARKIADRLGHVFGEPKVGNGSLTPTIWGGAPGIRYSGGVRGL
jgi:hypothetical protein